MTYTSKVRNTAERINATHGYGNVIACRVFLDGRVEVDVRGYAMKQETRRGRIVNGRLFFAHTSRKIEE